LSLNSFEGEKTFFDFKGNISLSLSAAIFRNLEPKDAWNQQR
jgi:hypothetical protein